MTLDLSFLARLAALALATAAVAGALVLGAPIILPVLGMGFIYEKALFAGGAALLMSAAIGTRLGLFQSGAS